MVGRYFHHMDLSARVAHERLSRICFVDYDRAIALVAELPDGDIVAIARLMRARCSRSAGGLDSRRGTRWKTA
jgi:acetyltransferase